MGEELTDLTCRKERELAKIEIYNCNCHSPFIITDFLVDVV